MGICSCRNELVEIQEVRLKAAALHLLQPESSMLWLRTFGCGFDELAEGLAIWSNALACAVAALCDDVRKLAALSKHDFIGNSSPGQMSYPNRADVIPQQRKSSKMRDMCYLTLHAGTCKALRTVLPECAHRGGSGGPPSQNCRGRAWAHLQPARALPPDSDPCRQLNSSSSGGLRRQLVEGVDGVVGGVVRVGGRPGEDLHDPVDVVVRSPPALKVGEDRPPSAPGGRVPED